jgi:serine/threonine-protein kinase RsbW
MSGAATSERERATEGVTRLRVADGPLLRPVLCRVVSMVLTRADWPLDRLDDALLVCDALCAHGPDRGERERPTFSVEADESSAELRVCDLSHESAEQLVRDARLPLVGNVLDRIAERVLVERDETGTQAQLTIVLSAR